MQTIRRFAAIAAALAAMGAYAQSDEPLLATSRENWPTEITRRPLTLGEGMFEVTAPVNVNVSEGADWQPWTINPSLYVGVSDRWMLGVRHLVGLCLGDEEDGCAETYNDVSVDSVLSLGKGGGLDLALGLSLNYAPIDPAAWSGEARLILRAGGGAFALTVAPQINFGLNERDSNRTKWAAGSFNLGTYNLVRAIADLENKEILSVPATLQLQLGPTLAVALGASVDGPLNPSEGDFGDFYIIPVQAAAVLTPTPWIDVGASFTFQNLLGEDSSEDFRALSFFAAFRL